MGSNSVISITGVRCRPDQEENLDKWMNERHIPDLLKFKGIKRATHYKRLTPDEQYPVFINVYEFENEQDFKAYNASPELAEASKERDATWSDDWYERMWRVQYKIVKTWER